MPPIAPDDKPLPPCAPDNKPFPPGAPDDKPLPLGVITVVEQILEVVEKDVTPDLVEKTGV